jgi:hypothetical protein
MNGKQFSVLASGIVVFLLAIFVLMSPDISQVRDNVSVVRTHPKNVRIGGGVTAGVAVAGTVLGVMLLKGK